MRAQRNGRSLRTKMQGTTSPRARLFVLARHAESSANVAGVVSGVPSRSVGLTPRGQGQARQLGAQLANLDINLAVCTRFLRTQQTVALALQARGVPVLVDAGFDEVRADDFDGQPIETYWSWEQEHAASDRLPHGESRKEALLRHAAALRRLLSRTEPVTLLVVHEFALRHITAAAPRSASPTAQPPFANAVPYLFDEDAIERAASYMGDLFQSELDEHRRSEPVGDRQPFTGEWNFGGP
jgi:broad specificity phosphatase PhoE